MTALELIDLLAVLPSDTEILLMPGHPCDSEYLVATSLERLPGEQSQVILTSSEYPY
jgi:hypothetical protein